LLSHSPTELYRHPQGVATEGTTRDLPDRVHERSCPHEAKRLTEPGMTQALKGRGGICGRVIENGEVRVGDEIELL
jgi:hypothetical protein